VLPVVKEGQIMADSASPQGVKLTLDCIGLYCPAPVLKTREEIDKIAIGEILKVLADDPAAEEDIKAWAKRAGQRILEIEKTDEGMRFLIQKLK
jgi:tRNA 2-thiouridine synthesizing protein A